MNRKMRNTVAAWCLAGISGLFGLSAAGDAIKVHKAGITEQDKSATGNRGMAKALGMLATMTGAIFLMPSSRRDAEADDNGPNLS